MTIAPGEIAETFAEAQAQGQPGQLAETDLGAGPETVADDEGYDEEQRAEILEVESTGANNGTIQTDLRPDMGGGDADDDEVEDDADRLDRVEDTDASFIEGSRALEGENSEQLLDQDPGAITEGDDQDEFDVDDEESSDRPGEIGA